jgi:hypothetical protein
VKDWSLGSKQGKRAGYHFVRVTDDGIALVWRVELYVFELCS